MKDSRSCQLLDLPIRDLHGDRDLLQKLIVEGVGAIKLEDQVLRENMLDTLHDILGLRFRELHRLARLEERAKVGDLGDGGKALDKHVVTSRSLLGLLLGGGHDATGLARPGLLDLGLDRSHGHGLDVEWLGTIRQRVSMERPLQT